MKWHTLKGLVTGIKKRTIVIHPIDELGILQELQLLVTN